MERWGHVTIARQIVRGEDSPVGKSTTEEGRSKRRSMVERQVSSDQSSRVGE